MAEQSHSTDKQLSTSTAITAVGGASNVTNGTGSHYKGVLHPDSLIWCHGSIGLEHEKTRRFRYPFYKYSHTQDASVYKIIICVCKNCNMTFYGDHTKLVPLSIPIRKLDSYTPYEIPVSINGKTIGLRGEIVTPFRQATQEELTDETREFIEKVQ